MYKWCTKCNNTRSGDFCFVCGYRLRERIKCKCGQVLHPVDKYCPGCGKKTVDEVKEAV